MTTEITESLLKLNVLANYQLRFTVPIEKVPLSDDVIKSKLNKSNDPTKFAFMLNDVINLPDGKYVDTLKTALALTLKQFGYALDRSKYKEQFLHGFRLLKTLESYSILYNDNNPYSIPAGSKEYLEKIVARLNNLIELISTEIVFKKDKFEEIQNQGMKLVEEQLNTFLGSPKKVKNETKLIRKKII